MYKKSLNENERKIKTDINYNRTEIKSYNNKIES